MTDKKSGGEGNRAADRRYRDGVADTVRATTEEERARRARDLDGSEKDDAESAADEAKQRAKG